MNYWHIQLHPNDQEEFDREQVTRILKDTGLIGVGEWPDGATKIRQFVYEMTVGDIVLVRSSGPLALVEITGEPTFDVSSRDDNRIDWFENRRQIKILDWYSDEVRAKAGRKVDKIYNVNSFSTANNSSFIKRWHQLVMSQQQTDNIAQLLLGKHQIILQGPPGTGKTHLAKIVANNLATDKALDWKLIQFHPAYAYEDFVRGIVPVTTEAGSIAYNVEDKVLAEFASEAAKPGNKNRKYVLIIDEINRANLPAVLGELIYALEYRGKEVEGVYGRVIDGKMSRTLVLPKNLLIIGTMNTADRSVGHLDYAIRRRFAFVNVLPDAAYIHKDAQQLFTDVQQLFTDYLSEEFSADDVRPGHSYFMADENKGLSLAQKLEYEIKPLLREYVRDGILNTDAKDRIKRLHV
jgi:5-methylcytosine-specific restriction endonuclease McrBC GTP-binding regulatory subunit McrB